MTHTRPTMRRPLAHTALALGMALGLSACGGMSQNQMLESIHQPQISHASYTLDLAVGDTGPSVEEAQRLDGWLSAMGLRYGDRVSLIDPAQGQVARGKIASVVGRYGLLLQPDAPATPGELAPGMVRVVLVRASANVPGCPDWRDTSEVNYNNATSRNYGCATNANLAAMIANPDDLVKGTANNSHTATMTGDKAIAAYRTAATTGASGQLKQTSSKGGN